MTMKRSSWLAPLALGAALVAEPTRVTSHAAAISSAMIAGSIWS